jgi:hypothetical protein
LVDGKRWLEDDATTGPKPAAPVEFAAWGLLDIICVYVAHAFYIICKFASRPVEPVISTIASVLDW